MEILFVVGIVVAVIVVLFGLALTWRDALVSENGGTISGLVAKISSILNLGPPKALQDLRWKLVKKEGGRKSLVVAFAGGGIRMGGVPRREFVRTMEKLENCDVLFVTDPEQCFYGRNVDQWVDDLGSLCKSYEGVLFVGNCMGSTGALGLGSRLKVDRILVFAPICAPHEDPRWNVRNYTQWCLNSAQRNSLRDAVVASVAECRQGVEVHRNFSEKDLLHTALLEKAPSAETKLKVIPYKVPGYEESSVAKYLRAENKLVHVIEENLRIACS
eukprot:CAMPEP_0201523934 /NCGR_PEP_ID=MMETSP0161_2-20130828/21007_1 /ASSEMBLY_ACC=CAM_ASM_000251 /TAXON_ID=180227 /ORGANISM="Neoparamoeba aestuarina, Strain SoJaBio B1-5/56/2" /LENGTH=272 /DNA_ID=CAMNT_0047923173 /DNA_START=157 /DNA_END=975 /DNA_ORIENTATION=-